jgi:sugar-specific transcriptional regulator TrmB
LARSSWGKKAINVSHERIVKALEDLGLSQTEAQIYVYLAAKGPRRTKDISDSLHFKPLQISASLRNLENKGIVKKTTCPVDQFAAVPFKRTLKMLIQEKTKEAQNIKENKEEILSIWSQILKED